MDIQPLAGALGAEIRGVALATLEDERAWRDIHRAFLDFSVLAARAQALGPADLMRVGGRFGEPCYYPFVTGIEGYPYIFEVVKEEQETTNFGGSWHSDTTYLREPPLATLLYALETPAQGGDTLFASTSAAYDALSPAMRELLAGLIGVNSAALKYGGGRRARSRSGTTAAGSTSRSTTTTASAGACGGGRWARRCRASITPGGHR